MKYGLRCKPDLRGTVLKKFEIVGPSAPAFEDGATTEVKADLYDKVKVSCKVVILALIWHRLFWNMLNPRPMDYLSQPILGY